MARCACAAAGDGRARSTALPSRSRRGGSPRGSRRRRGQQHGNAGPGTAAHERWRPSRRRGPLHQVARRCRSLRRTGQRQIRFEGVASPNCVYSQTDVGIAVHGFDEGTEGWGRGLGRGRRGGLSTARRCSTSIGTSNGRYGARRALEPRRRPRHARRGTALPASASWSTIARGRARRLGRPCGWRQKAHPRRHAGSSRTSPARQRRYRYRHEPDRLDLARHLGWCREEQCR